MKSLLLLCFCLALSSSIASAASIEVCEFRFFRHGPQGDYMYYTGDNVAPFDGYSLGGPFQSDRIDVTYPSVGSVQGGFCELCTMTVYSTSTFSGRSAFYDFKEGFEFIFPFCVKSFDLDCRDPPQEEEEEEQVDNIEYISLSPSYEITSYLEKLKRRGVDIATQLAGEQGTIPFGFYEVTVTRDVEQAVNIEGWYRFDVDVTDNQGTDLRVVFAIWDNPSFQGPEVQSWTIDPIN